MVILLYIIGAFIVVLSIIFGISTGTFFGFITHIFIGTVIAIIFFALARMLDLLEALFMKSEFVHEKTSFSKLQEQIACPNCGENHDSGRKSCPYCAHRY
ncbi:hypothetical protein [Gracilibacillus sp. YIM 98692]|uniref:hypothetical protein n=1 Tax=Gracilibacillus sp. YIM 98692 TaxID=2663532 RepID=UPI0013D56C1F|nr:hypothetical protein [Gracilibacillus sp. YIM 98692]